MVGLKKCTVTVGFEKCWPNVTPMPLNEAEPTIIAGSAEGTGAS